MREIYKINRFNCIINGGMLDHREYKLNNCLKEYMQGKCGIFRALLIGLFGSNSIKSYGTYINYYIINHYDFIENVYADFENSSKLTIIVTTKRKLFQKEIKRINTVLIKLFSNQSFTLTNKDLDGSFGVKDIEIIVSNENRDETIEQYKKQLNCHKDFFEWRIKLLSKQDRINSFYNKYLKLFPSLVSFFKNFNEELNEEEMKKILEQCDILLKRNGKDNFFIKKQ